jgi:hypothetical protein
MLEPFIGSLCMLVWIYGDPGLANGTKNTLGIELADARVIRE